MIYKPYAEDQTKDLHIHVLAKNFFKNENKVI